MSQTPIELKGSSFTLSVIHLHHTQPEVVSQALQDKIDQAPAFLKNAPVVLNVSSLNGAVNWKEMVTLLASTTVNPVSVAVTDRMLLDTVVHPSRPMSVRATTATMPHSTMRRRGEVLRP